MMTESMSPQPYGLGRKRCSMDDDIIMENSFSFDDNFHQKKNKRQESENICSPIGFYNSFPSQPTITEQQRNIPFSVASERSGLSAQVDQLQKYHESVMTSIKLEHQMAMDKKTQEVNQMKALNSALIQNLNTLKKEHQVTLEDNKILKKAVTIQDGRSKELQAQHQNLQNVMQLAMTHIAKLEEANRELQSALRTSVSSNQPSFGYNYQPPPDLY